MAEGNGNGGITGLLNDLSEQFRSSQVWTSIFRPGSPFRGGYSDTPRNRSYVVMNNVMYHLHPVKVKRHGVRLSYTLCLGGLSFFLFVVLTITGIFLMFYYRPTSPQAYIDIQALATDVAFGQFVRNMHRWGAHLMVLTVFLHMTRVFYHGASGVQLGRRRHPVAADAAAVVQRLPTAVGSAGAVGLHRRFDDGVVCAGVRR